MEIVKKLKAEMLTARKAKDTKLVASIALVVSEIENIGKNDSNRETTDDEAIALIKKMVLRNEELIGYMDAGPAKEKLENEVVFLQKYLPCMTTMDDVEDFIDEQMANGADNIGRLMGALKKEYGQSVDMKAAGAIVRQKLNM